MKVVSFLLVLIALLFVAQNVVAQKEQTLDRETIEWILQNIDAECKEGCRMLWQTKETLAINVNLQFKK